jgi:Protein of unknown function (DUF1566)
MALFAAAGLLQTVRGQGAYLRLRSDLECRLNIDGRPGDVLKPGDEVRLNLAPGDHRIEAVPVTGGATWQATVTLTEADPQEVSIPLRAAVVRAQAKTRGYWVDPQSRLMWAAADNGFGVSWSQAVYYCRSLTAAGYSDWTLPTIEELHGLFGGSPNESGHRVAGPIKLTGWAWSGSAGQEPGEHWALDFGDGARASVVDGDSGLNRALCVRRSSK